MFVASTADSALPASITVKVADKSASNDATVLSLIPQVAAATLAPHNCLFTQIEAATAAGVAIQKYGAILIPASAETTDLKLELTVNGTKYTAATNINAATEVGTSVTFSK